VASRARCRAGHAPAAPLGLFRHAEICPARPKCRAAHPPCRQKRLRTIKANNPRGPFGRREWEEEIRGDEPDKQSAKLLKKLGLKKLRRRLVPVFETDVQRTVLPIRCDGSAMEIAVDHGAIKTGARREPISEIEIELKEGAAAGVVNIAKRIADDLPVGYGAKPKSARGYALSAGENGQPVFAADIVLAPDISAGAAFRVIGLSCLRHLAGNRDAVRCADAEGIHQMRVGLRRLRAAMSIFKSVIDGPECHRVKRELKWLMGELDAARDLDVLIKGGLRPLHNSRQGHLRQGKAGIALLESELKEKREKQFARAKTAAESGRYRKAIIDTALWIANGDWSSTSDPLIAARRERGAADFAAGELSRRARKIIKRVKRLDDLHPRQQHKLRIAIKKMRYACQFFASLFGAGKAAKARARLERRLKTLQSALGRLNDIRVHERLAGEYAKPRLQAKRKPQKAFAMGLLAGKEEASVQSLMAQARDAGKRFAKQPPFWS
jgi:triphosphatase